MKKPLAITLYVLYSIILVLTVTYGTGVAKKISDGIKTATYEKNINDVVLNLDTNAPLSAGGSYKLEYEVDGASADEAQLIFESSNPDVLKIANKTIYTYSSFSGEEAEVDVKITSKRDADFEKIITLRVKKNYPKKAEVNYLIEGSGYNRETLQVGMAVYVYASTSEKNVMNTYELIYDTDHFTYDEKKCAYIVTKETLPNEKLVFIARYPDGTERVSKPFAVTPYVGIEDFNEVRSKDENLEGLAVSVNQSIIPLLYKDGKNVNTAVDISCSNPDAMRITSAGHYIFSKPGNYTLTFTLPNGFSRSASITVENVMALPEVADQSLIVDGHIKITNGDTLVVQLEYPGGVTFTEAEYECNNECASVTAGWKSFTVTANKLGTTTVTLILDDGMQRIEKTYVVEVVEGAVLEQRVLDAIDQFVAKFLGHTIFFAILAIFSMNMFRFVEIKNWLVRFVLYVMTALPWAALTEIIQKYMPGRYARVQDVIIDMCGFMIGTVIIVLIRCSANKRRRRREIM